MIRDVLNTELPDEPSSQQDRLAASDSAAPPAAASSDGVTGDATRPVADEAPIAHKPVLQRVIGWTALAVMLALIISASFGSYSAGRFAGGQLRKDQPRTLLRMMGKTKHTRVRYGFINYYRLRDLIPGATIVLDERYTAHEWYLRRVARLGVEVSPERLAIRKDAIAGLKKRATFESKLRTSSRVKDFFVVAVDGATKYMLVRTGKGVFLMPENLYQEAAVATKS